MEVDINSSKSFDEQLEERYGPDAEFLEKIFDDLIKGSWDDYEDPGPDSSNEEMGEAEVKFALGVLRKRYSELAQEARDVAVLACNQNGIYQ